MLQRIVAFGLALILALALTACGSKGEDYIFSYDLAGKVTSLDPQFAASSPSKTVIYNTFEGLLLLGAEGELEPGVATGYQLSPDQKTYTFTLREDAKWSNGDPVTAADFRFAFRRLFDPTSPSPYAGELIAIENAPSVLSGALPLERLGVSAPDAHTLVITLAYPTPQFPTLLVESYAMPCQEKFFLDQKGRYGLDQTTTLFNGPFYVRTLDNSKSINLRANQNYHSEKPATAAGVNLYVNRENPTALFLEDGSDAAIVQSAQLSQVQEMGGTAQGVPDTVWALLWNQKEPVFANETIRTALGRALDLTLVAQSLTQGAATTTDFIPSSATLTGHNYRQLVGPLPPLTRDSTLRPAYEEALATLDMTRLPKIDLLVLDGKMERSVAGALQQSWQRELNAYINIQPLSQGDLQSALTSGSYQMILAPFSPAAGKPESLLTPFSSENNAIGIRNPVLDGLLESASLTGDPQQAAGYLYRAESLLQQSCTLLPLYTTSTYYAMGKGVTGVQFRSSQGVALFKYAQKS